MKTDEQLLNELKEFSVQFLAHGIYSVRGGGWETDCEANCDKETWDRSSALRESFDKWLESESWTGQNILAEVDFSGEPSIQIFTLTKQIGMDLET